MTRACVYFRQSITKSFYNVGFSKQPLASSHPAIGAPAQKVLQPAARDKQLRGGLIKGEDGGYHGRGPRLA
jgi:hypothetical protein